MSTANPAPVEQTPNAGGAGEPNPTDTVAYETHRKLLAEKKKVQEELAAKEKRLQELEAAQKKAHEDSLREKEDFKALAALREKEKQEIELKLKEKEEVERNSKKLGRFLDEVNGKVSKEYWNLIDLEKIVIDPATGDPDPLSVQKAAREFEKVYGKVLDTNDGSSTLPPNGAARKVSTAKITRAQYDALKTVKEQREAFNNVDWNT